jgi:hypothetical protein
MPITKTDPRIFNKDFDIKSLDDIANVVANEWVVLLRQSLQKNNRVSTGTLEASLVPEVNQSPSYIQINVLDSTTNGYAKFVDKGVSGRSVKYDTKFSFKGKNINQQAMLDFIANRGEYMNPIVESISQFFIKNGEKHKRKKPLPMNEARQQLAFILGAKIANRGLKPTHFVDEAIGKKQIEDLKKKIKQGILNGLK